MILGDRFWFKVEKTESCWLWQGSMTAKGYGEFRWEGRKRYAHRLTYEMAHGPIPLGMQIDHKCRVPRCVNPVHLQAVTPQQNLENRAGATVRSKSGVRGVFRYRGKWRVMVVVRGQQHWGGDLRDLQEAEAIASAMRRQLMTNSLADQS